MDKKELSMLGFEIVAYSGDARSTLLKLIHEAKAGNFANIESALQEADENLKLAHNAQTQVLAQEAGGKDLEIGFIFYSRAGSSNDYSFIKRDCGRFRGAVSRKIQ